MAAFPSSNDRKSFPRKLRLSEGYILSYPSATIDKDGSIYIVYDQGRSTVGQHTIFLSKITEADILTGKVVSTESFLDHSISRPSLQDRGRQQGEQI